MKRMMKRRRLNSKREGEAARHYSSRTCSIQDEEEEEDKDKDKEKENHNTPLRPIFCLKNSVDLKRFDEMEDCYLLDFDPNLNLSFSKDDNSEVSLVGEKGQVACRDYPHARHLCLKFPFETTPHQTYCQMCYCYVCDATAPCDLWMQHCHASHTSPFWKRLRHFYNNNNSPPPPHLGAH